MSRTAPPELLPPGEPPNGHADYDTLAELFLGDDRAAAEPDAPAPGRPRPAPEPGPGPIEGLVLGHLPVLASAWVQQYARHLSGERGGPVGLLRLRAGEAQLDLVAGRGQPPRPFDTLEQAIQEAAREAVAWVLRVDQTTEPRLPELKGLGSVTLLTGADEAAVVAAYTALKNLVKPSNDDEGPELRVAIMGAGPEKAAEASAKLERAAAVFIGRPVRIAQCIARIGGKASTVLFRGPWAGTVDQAIAMMGTARSRAPRSEPVEPETSPKLPPPASPTRPEPVVSRLGRLHAGPANGVCGPLAGHIAGLKGIDITCPYAAGVEFALDESGVMHLLGRLETTDLAGLLAAAAWVQAHHGLLRMALAAQVPGFRGTDAAVLHLFTDDARRVRALGDSPVRLHLLARAETAGGIAWLSSPLN